MEIKKDWDFSGEVSKKFEEHISKSIPNYRKIHETVVRLIEFVCPKYGEILDIGCSNANLLLSLNKNYKERKISMYGYEIEKDMYDLALENTIDTNIKIINDDLLAINDKERFNVILSIFTLQFLTYKKRKIAIKKLFEATEKGGVVLLAEKLLSNDVRNENVLSSMLREDKLNNGIRENEIIAKELSLRGVMNCKTNKEIEEEFLGIGFESIELINKENSFALYIIRK